MEVRRTNRTYWLTEVISDVVLLIRDRGAGLNGGCCLSCACYLSVSGAQDAETCLPAGWPSFNRRVLEQNNNLSWRHRSDLWPSSLSYYIFCVVAPCLLTCRLSSTFCLEVLNYIRQPLPLSLSNPCESEVTICFIHSRPSLSLGFLPTSRFGLLTLTSKPSSHVSLT